MTVKYLRSAQAEAWTALAGATGDPPRGGEDIKGPKLPAGCDRYQQQWRVVTRGQWRGEGGGETLQGRGFEEGNVLRLRIELHPGWEAGDLACLWPQFCPE